MRGWHVGGAVGCGLVNAGRTALARGAPILCDTEMVAHGITRSRLPARNEVFCALRDPDDPMAAETIVLSGNG